MLSCRGTIWSQCPWTVYRLWQWNVEVHVDI